MKADPDVEVRYKVSPREDSSFNLLSILVEREVTTTPRNSVGNKQYAKATEEITWEFDIPVKEVGAMFNEIANLLAYFANGDAWREMQ